MKNDWIEFKLPLANGWYDIKMNGGAIYKRCWFAYDMFHFGKHSLTTQNVAFIKEVY